MLYSSILTEKILGAAIEVHRELGPGLFESTYEACMAHELSRRNVRFERQVAIPVVYKGDRLDAGFRADLIVDSIVVVELKAVERLLPVHQVQLMTYLRLSGRQIGLLLNFNVARLKDGGIIRRVL